MEGFRSIFQGVDDFRESRAKKCGLIDILAAALELQELAQKFAFAPRAPGKRTA